MPTLKKTVKVRCFVENRYLQIRGKFDLDKAEKIVANFEHNQFSLPKGMSELAQKLFALYLKNEDEKFVNLMGFEKRIYLTNRREVGEGLVSRSERKLILNLIAKRIRSAGLNVGRVRRIWSPSESSEIWIKATRDPSKETGNRCEVKLLTDEEAKKYYHRSTYDSSSF